MDDNEEDWEDLYEENKERGENNKPVDTRMKPTPAVAEGGNVWAGDLLRPVDIEDMLQPLKLPANVLALGPCVGGGGGGAGMAGELVFPAQQIGRAHV